MEDEAKKAVQDALALAVEAVEGGRPGERLGKLVEAGELAAEVLSVGWDWL